MKKILLFILFSLTTTFFVNAQSLGLGGGACFSYVCPDPTFSGSYERAMYVDDFLRFSNGALRTDLSILGEPADETALFNYCNNNNITTIYLYNFKEVYDRFNINYPSTSTTYATLFSDFISDAHSHGLTVGVAIGGMEANKKVFWWNGNRSPWKCVSIIADPDAALLAVQTEIDLVPTGEYSPYLESVKEIIQVYIYSKYFNPDNNTIDFNNPQITCNPSVQINRIITEYEFYRHFLVGGAPDLAMNTLDYQNYLIHI